MAEKRCGKQKRRCPRYESACIFHSIHPQEPMSGGSSQVNLAVPPSHRAGGGERPLDLGGAELDLRNLDEGIEGGVGQRFRAAV
jgi:hypothetical protein